jgi:hypothetical protein
MRGADGKRPSGDAFVEVIVDYSSGVVLEVETISDGGDLAAPSLDNGHPVAEVTLAHGDDWKVVTERLD